MLPLNLTSLATALYNINSPDTRAQRPRKITEAVRKVIPLWKILIWKSTLQETAFRVHLAKQTLVAK